MKVDLREVGKQLKTISDLCQSLQAIYFNNVEVKRSEALRTVCSTASSVNNRHINVTVNVIHETHLSVSPDICTHSKMLFVHFKKHDFARISSFDSIMDKQV